jgi:hypothetical protein
MPFSSRRDHYFDRRFIIASIHRLCQFCHSVVLVARLIEFPPKFSTALVEEDYGALSLTLAEHG